MSDPLMIGTRGWNHVSGGDFYPPELPDDWRFCFYSNNLRSVLVPQALWSATSRADVTQWLEDSDPTFRFVLELPAELCEPLTQARRERALEEFLDKAEPVATRLAGLVLPIPAQTPFLLDWLEHLLNRLADVAPVCVDLPEGPWREPSAHAALERQGAGRVWHCARDQAPHPGGRLLIALAPAVPAREVRQLIERLAPCQGLGAQAGLFFDADAARVAQEARLIAELMGV